MMTIILVDLAIIAVLLTADLLSKHYVESFLLARGGSYDVIQDILTFRYSRNSGAAFGIFEDARVFLSVFVGIVLLALIGFMVYLVLKKKHKEKGGMLLQVSLSMIFAGGLGNLVDRIAFGYVRDFIDYTFLYTWFGLDFAICNLADVFLTIGIILAVICLIYQMVIDAKREKEAEAAEPDSDAAQDVTEKSEEGKDGND